MNCVLKILCHLCIFNWTIAQMTYFHEYSYIEIQPPVVSDKTDFGFSMGYSRERNALIVGAPHHDLNGKVFRCSVKEIIKLLKNKTSACSEIDIDMEKLAGNYSRELAPDQNFCLGSSISVASGFILTCAPLWRTIISDLTSTKLKYGSYGACFVIREGVRRLKGAFEQLPELKPKQVKDMLEKVHAGSGWSTLIDETNNITLVSLSPFSDRTDIGYMDTIPPLGLMKFMNVHKNINNMFKNLGTFTMGKFFEDNKLTYAYSFRRKRMSGVVAFLQRPAKSNGKWEVKEHNGRTLYIDALDMETGSMFGAALSATDLNSDGFSDLLVGAPAQGLTDLYYDSGAVHIFLGGKKLKIKERRTIMSTKSQGYFGRTIATKDIDGDKIPEIFVSAPFEDSGSGALYVLNGQEIKNFVENSNPLTVKQLIHFKFTQRIQNTQYRSFGYSLQLLSDLDGNGYNELAVGAPHSGKVLLYRSIPSLIIYASADIDRDYVRLSDLNCSIRMNINIKYPVKPEEISEWAKLNSESCEGFQTVKLSGAKDTRAEFNVFLECPVSSLDLKQGLEYYYVHSDGAVSKVQSYYFNIIVGHLMLTHRSNKHIVTVLHLDEYFAHIECYNGLSERDQTVYLICTTDIEPGLYMFNANVKLKFNDYLKDNKVFNKAMIVMSPYSNATVAVPISRHCKDEDCVPNLLANIQLPGRKKHFILGSSTSETLMVTILNKGKDTFVSCVKILLEGSEVLYVNAEQDSAGWYQYMLPKPFVKDSVHTIEIQLDMTKQTNLDKKVLIKLALFNICNRGNFTVHDEEIPFVLSTKEVFVNSFTNERNITDTEILDSKIKVIKDDHTYTVVNTGSVVWKTINAEIKINKEKFIKSYDISKLDSINCTRKEDTETYTFFCNFDLEKSIKIIITLDIAKDMIKDNLKDNHLTTSSIFKLYLQPTEDVKINQIRTIFYYRIDASLGQNKTLIIVIAVILSALILMAITYILCKGGFFKNKEKTELDDLKDQIRKQSVPEGNETAARQETNEVQEKNEEQEAIEEQEITEGQETTETH